MPSNFTSVTVDWYDAEDSYVTTVDITEHVKSIPLFTDTGTGEVNEAKIILKSLKGRFITADLWVTFTSYEIGDRVSFTGDFYLCLVAHTSGTFATDLVAGKWSQEADVDIHDRFRIRCTDKASNSYDKYFEVLNIIPSQSKGEGTLLTLECLGIEYHTQHIHMAHPYYFEDAFTVAKSIGDFYNENKGTDQPFLSQTDSIHDGIKGNGFPFYTANIYEYGLNEDKCYNRWMDVLEKLGNSVSTGGTLTFYELDFKSTGVNAMDFSVRASGNNTTAITIKNAKVTNPLHVGEQEGVLSNPTGSSVMAWGSNEHGTLPTEFSKYDSNLMFFAFRPEWVTSRIFAVGAKIKFTISGIAKHYECDVAHTSGTFADDLAASPTPFWHIISMKDEFGDTVQYSPWTESKATVIGNCGPDPNRATLTTGSWLDINCVINDTNGYFRTWVDARVSSADMNAELTTLSNDTGSDNEGYSYDLTSARLPNGFRVLVDGSSNTANGVFTGNDDMVMEFRRLGPTATGWRELYRFDLGTVPDATPKVNVVVIHEGKIYEGAAFNASVGSRTWTAKDGANYGNDCIHPYTTAPAA